MANGQPLSTKYISTTVGGIVRTLIVLQYTSTYNTHKSQNMKKVTVYNGKKGKRQKVKWKYGKFSTSNFSIAQQFV
jgi:hypothetical protein